MCAIYCIIGAYRDAYHQDLCDLLDGLIAVCTDADFAIQDDSYVNDRPQASGIVQQLARLNRALEHDQQDSNAAATAPQPLKIVSIHTLLTHTHTHTHTSTH